MDRLATRKDALNRTESYQYDPAGNLTQFTDRKNQVTTFSYDSLNRRIGANYADGSSTSFIYDSVGRLTRATDSIAGTIEFNYDNLDRLNQETTPQGTVSYQYDALWRRAQMTANGQQPVSYQYDAASRLTQVAQGTQVVGIGYDNASRRTNLTYPNGTNTSYSYDNASRLTSITHNGPAGLLDSLSYTYDAAGNRISLTRANGTTSNLPAAVQAAYDAANQQIQFNAGSPNQAFDADGNLISDGTNTYTWDVRNRLTAISGPGLSASFTYDALGRRASKAINGATTGYLYDGNDIVQEIGGGAVSVSYLRSKNVDEAFVRQSDENLYYHADALGSTLILTNGTGISPTSYSYEPFGKTTIVGSSQNAFQYTGRENDGTGLFYYRARYYSASAMRFVTEDPKDTPLFEVSRGRSVGSPNLDRYLARDIELSKLLVLRLINVTRASSVDPKMINLYTYADDNPLNLVDPEGLAASPQVPGCDYVGRVLSSDCSVGCCNAHDACYVRSCCTMASWLPGVGTPACKQCNDTIARCLRGCECLSGRKCPPPPSTPNRSTFGFRGFSGFSGFTGFRGLNR